VDTEWPARLLVASSRDPVLPLKARSCDPIERDRPEDILRARAIVPRRLLLIRRLKSTTARASVTTV
jgi:hypothetical protein